MQITKATLTRVFTTDKNKEGLPLISKAGKPYSKMSIKCVEHGDKWLSGFKGRENEFWKEGDVVDIMVKQNGEYLNFEVPKAEDKLEMRVAALEVDMLNIRNSLAGNAKVASAVAPVAAPVLNPAALDEPPF